MKKTLKPGIDFIGVTTPFFCHDGRGNFLFHQRSKNCRDEKEHWDCGGGLLNFGERPEDSVLREVHEEYGVKGKIDEQLPVYSLFRKSGRRKTHWVVFPFIIRVNRKKVRINEPKKMNALKWSKINKFPKPLHSGVRYEFKNYRPYFRKYECQ